MKEKIEVLDYAETILKALPKGILLNTQAERFNSMVIGWGHLGTLWSMPTFHVYVREHRFTKEQMDNPLANKDVHTMYVGKIVSAYIIR